MSAPKTSAVVRSKKTSSRDDLKICRRFSAGKDVQASFANPVGTPEVDPFTSVIPAGLNVFYSVMSRPLKCRARVSTGTLDDQIGFRSH